MSRHHESERMFEIFPENYVPSGIYICPPTLISTISLANPFFQKNSPYRLANQEVGENVQTILNEIRQEPDCYVLNLADIYDYSHGMVKAARQFKEVSYGSVLCPLRGSRMPTVQVATMCEAEDKFHAFNFSYGAQGEEDDRIAKDLCEILESAGTGHSDRIAVLDTAIGGNGSLQLATLLNTRVFPELGFRPQVDFHLVHEQTRIPKLSYQIPRYGFNTVYYPVRSLLIEDKSPLLGYETVRSQRGLNIHPLTSPGKIAVVGPGELAVYEADALDQAAIGIIGQEIGKALDGLPDVELRIPNYWQQRFQQQQS